MASQQINEIEEMVKTLQKKPGFRAYLILNNDGIVLKWEQKGNGSMPYQKAVQYSHHVMDLCSKSKTQIQELFDSQDSQVESIRLRTDDYELIAAQEGNYTLVVIQDGGTHTNNIQEEETIEST